jgi:hypothetical protein
MDRARLIKIRDDRDIPAMRAHAWDIFAGLTDGFEHPEPIWETWYTKCDVGLVRLASDDCKRLDSGNRSGRARVLSSLDLSVQDLLAFQQSLKSANTNAFGKFAVPIQDLSAFMVKESKHPQFASVLFNFEAAEHIVTEKLSDRNGLGAIYETRVAKRSSKKQGEIDPFPSRAVAIKLVWALVHDNGGILPVLFIPNQKKLDAVRAMGADQAISAPQDWGASVTIDTLSNRSCGEEGDSAAGSDPKLPVPLDCFYSYKFNSDEEAREFPSDLAVQFGHQTIQPGHTFLLLVGVHVVTKETPDWVWATFWWQPGLSDAPPSVKGSKWRHFQMDTTLSDVTPLEPPKDNRPKICFNPYLEAQFPNGIVSNCVECHERAVYAPQNQGSKTAEGINLGLPWRDGTPAVGQPLNDKYYDEALKTDFLWSIPNSQNSLLTDFSIQMKTLIREHRDR